MSFLPADKVRVFISSTLQECTAERQIVKEAIDSLNHVPVMFEAAGARPHPPRDVYLGGLENSQIFIGIYRESYGWVAPDMKISGLEDELQYARDRGMPVLTYVLRGVTPEPRLQVMLDSLMGSGVTVAFFENSKELYDKVRDDLTALISSYFRGASYQFQTPLGPPAEFLSQIVQPGKLVPRTAAEKSILTLVEQYRCLVVRGILGIGKTVLLAALADQQGWLFIPCKRLTALEILNDATNALYRKLDKVPIGFTDIGQVRRAFAHVASECTNATIVLDDVQDLQALEQVLVSDQGFEVHGPRVVVSTRDTSRLLGFAEFEVPPLNEEEIRSFVQLYRGTSPLPGELTELTLQSKGNPLYLRYYAFGDPGQFATDIQDYEARAWSILPARSQEAVNFLAMAGQPLGLNDLIALMNADTAPIEEVSAAISAAKLLLAENSRGYEIFHDHLRATLLELLKRTPTKHRFYAARLAAHCKKKRDYITAYLVLDYANDPAAENLLNQAAYQASVHGDVKRAITILERRLTVSKARGRQEDIVLTLLALAQVMKLNGRQAEALERLDEAKYFAANLPSEQVPFSVEEMRLSIIAQTTGEPSAIQALQDRQRSYLEQNDSWNAARLGLDLSVALIKTSRYREAYEQARQAWKAFAEHGDEYGVVLSKLNCLSCASALPEEKEVAKKLFANLNNLDPQQIPPRRRVFLLNVRGRQQREAGNTAEAKVSFREAIDISYGLGDTDAVCTNLINLGNAFRQERDYDHALEQYQAADRRAREAGLRHQEASANELIASIHNRKGNGELAKHFAFYALSLAKEGYSPRTEIGATEELADAHLHLGQQEEAAQGFRRLSSLIRKQDPKDPESYQQALRALRIYCELGQRKKYFEAYQQEILQTYNPAIPAKPLLVHFVSDLPALVRALPDDYVLEGITLHSQMMFNDLPIPIIRQAFLRALDRLSQCSELREEKILRATLAILLNFPPGILHLRDLALIAQKVFTKLQGIVLRLHTDGAAHWTLLLDFARPATVTISQLGDRDDTAVVCFALALFLKSYAADIQRQIIMTSHLPRVEANIQVVNEDEIRANVDATNIGLPQRLEHWSVVSRATNLKHDPSVPLLVITGNDIAAHWKLGLGQGGAAQALFAQTLVELIFHFFEGEVDLEELSPKVITVVKETIR